MKFKKMLPLLAYMDVWKHVKTTHFFFGVFDAGLHQDGTGCPETP